MPRTEPPESSPVSIEYASPATSAPVASVLTEDGWLRARFVAITAIVLYVAAIVAITAALRSPGVVARGNETTWDRAIFTSINAASLTGFQQTIGLREMATMGWSGPVLMLLLVVGGTLLSLIVGGLAAARVLGLSRTPGQIVRAAVACLLFAAVCGGALLALIGHGGSEAIFESICAFSNSGLWMGPTPAITALSSYLALLPLAVLGGLGLPVLSELADRIFGGPPLSRHSRAVLWLAAWVYLLGFAALFVAQVPAAAGRGLGAWRDTLASCSVAALNTRSAGIPFQSPAAFTAAGQWLLVVLMLIGGAPAGTAGGIKTTTLLHLFRGIRELVAGRPGSRALGVAATWLGVYLLMFLSGIVLLASTAPQIPADRMIFLACSALGNVGLWHDAISLTGAPLVVLSLLMLAGRLAPLAILWWMASRPIQTDVLIG